MDSEGLSHLSLSIIQDLDFHKVFPVALLELHILDTDIVVSILQNATQAPTVFPYLLTAGCSPLQRWQSHLLCEP